MGGSGVDLVLQHPGHHTSFPDCSPAHPPARANVSKLLQLTRVKKRGAGLQQSREEREEWKHSGVTKLEEEGREVNSGEEWRAEIYTQPGASRRKPAPGHTRWGDCGGTGKEAE